MLELISLMRALIVGERGILDDGGDGAVVAPNDAAIACGPSQFGGENGGGGVALPVLRANSASVSARTRGASPGSTMANLARLPSALRAIEHGVAGAALRLLQHGADSQRLKQGGNLLGLMADDGDDGARLERLAGAHDVLDQRAAAGAMQHFGQQDADACLCPRQE